MRTVEAWFDAYDHSHRHPVNKRIHWICVPLILMSTLGLLWEVPLPWVHAHAPYSARPWANVASLLAAGALVFYLRLSLRLCLGMLIVASLGLGWSLLIATLFPLHAWLINLCIFGIAWAGQFVGHRIEGAKPSFFQDLQFLLIGPAWVLRFVYTKLGIRL